MAKIFVLALGSRGDVQPFVALSVGLRDAGHQVVIATTAGFEDLVGGRGFEHVEVMGDVDAVVGSPDDDVAHAFSRHPIREGRRLTSLFFEQVDQVLATTPMASAGADLVLWWEPTANLGRHLAQALGVPGVAAGLHPPGWATSLMPSSMFPYSFDWLPSWLRDRYNLFTYTVAAQLTASFYRSRIDRWRRDTLGLPSLPLRASLSDQVAAPVLQLSGTSALVRDLPPEWRGHVKLSGYWVLPFEEDWTMPEALAGFLAEGPSPIFASMGSAVRFPTTLGVTVVEAARQAGVRLVLGSGWNRRGGLDTSSLPPFAIEVGSIPHEQVFPHMAGVIHHGGGGSTGASLRAGRPTATLPMFADQPYWGDRIAELGVGPAPLSAKRVTVDQLAGAMRRLVDDRQMRQRADELGRRLMAEDGVANAVEDIESVLAGAPTHRT